MIIELTNIRKAQVHFMPCAFCMFGNLPKIIMKEGFYMREKNSFPLKPNDGHKSFYGKAIIKKTDNGLILKSYQTNVAAFVNGRFVRLWNDYSVTSMRHINAFAAYCGIREGGKAWWMSLKVERI